MFASLHDQKTGRVIIHCNLPDNLHVGDSIATSKAVYKITKRTYIAGFNTLVYHGYDPDEDYRQEIAEDTYVQ